MATTASNNTGNNIGYIDTNDGAKKPYNAASYADMRGVVDFGNLVQFAPYETGYSFLAVINGPAMMTSDPLNDGRTDLQDAFIKILENEFKGLSGIEDISAETMDVTDNISTLSLISKTTQATNGTITMNFTEKSGGIISKYISTFIRYIKDPKTQAKHYGGLVNINANDGKNGYIHPKDAGFHKEVFNMLYVVTDSTCLQVEKAFLILNAQPNSAPFGDLYNSEKGSIDKVDISVSFNAFVVDGKIPNLIAKNYIETLVNTTDTFKSGKINVNSWNYDWSYASSSGDIKKSSKLSAIVDGKLTEGNTSVGDTTTTTENQAVLA